MFDLRSIYVERVERAGPGTTWEAPCVIAQEQSEQGKAAQRASCPETRQEGLK